MDLSMCVSVLAYVRAGARECVCAPVLVCVRQRDRETEGEIERD